MAITVLPLGHLTRTRSTRFLTSREKRNYNATPKFPYLSLHQDDHQCSPPHILISLRSRLHLSPHPLPIFFRLLSAPFSSPLSSMTSPQASTSPLQSSAKTVRVVIKGRVQGVFYRNWTIENANELGLKGWVRNRRDGSVEALFSGNSDSVQEMEQRCRRGPPSAIVTGLEVFPCSDDPGTGFVRKPTA